MKCLCAALFVLIFMSSSYGMDERLKNCIRALRYNILVPGAQSEVLKALERTKNKGPLHKALTLVKRYRPLIGPSNLKDARFSRTVKNEYGREKLVAPVLRLSNDENTLFIWRGQNTVEVQDLQKGETRQLKLKPRDGRELIPPSIGFPNFGELTNLAVTTKVKLLALVTEEARTKVYKVTVFDSDTGEQRYEEEINYPDYNSLTATVLSNDGKYLALVFHTPSTTDDSPPSDILALLVYDLRDNGTMSLVAQTKTTIERDLVMKFVGNDPPLFAFEQHEQERYFIRLWNFGHYPLSVAQSQTVDVSFGVDLISDNGKNFYGDSFSLPRAFVMKSTQKNPNPRRISTKILKDWGKNPSVWLRTSENGLYALAFWSQATSEDDTIHLSWFVKDGNTYLEVDRQEVNPRVYWGLDPVIYVSNKGVGTVFCGVEDSNRHKICGTRVLSTVLSIDLEEYLKTF